MAWTILFQPDVGFDKVKWNKGNVPALPVLTCNQENKIGKPGSKIKIVR